ncbi:HipA N-terminal domain-containing protein [Nocardiopsis kunsanensis]|uniref:HipA N-terminal domain-containing protein n=1 Tax=Nocardiopsis kunsanensis TaxID=141693 RepID=UPI000A0359E0|nr:HipA N-terminal domain-containing protein [Nocardiopsis kunsanensis]
MSGTRQDSTDDVGAELRTASQERRASWGLPNTSARRPTLTERVAVLLSGEIVGHLERAAPDEDPTFSYAAEYVQTAEAAPSARLPLQRAARLLAGLNKQAFADNLLDRDRRSWMCQLTRGASTRPGTRGSRRGVLDRP